jgi:hypothetical protein
MSEKFPLHDQVRKALGPERHEAMMMCIAEAASLFAAGAGTEPLNWQWRPEGEGAACVHITMRKL